MDTKDAPELHTIWDEARNHVESGNYDKAIEIYRYILIRYGEDDFAAERANAYLCSIFCRLQQVDLAEDYIKKAISHSPKKPGYHYILGFFYSFKQQWGKAIPELEIAVNKEPDKGEYLRELGWVVYNSGDQERGLAYLHEANRLAPTDTNTLAYLALSYLSTGDISKAKEYIESALRLDPEESVA